MFPEPKRQSQKRPLFILQTASANNVPTMVLVMGSTRAQGSSEEEARAAWRRWHLGPTFKRLGKWEWSRERGEEDIMWLRAQPEQRRRGRKWSDHCGMSRVAGTVSLERQTLALLWEGALNARTLS